MVGEGKGEDVQRWCGYEERERVEAWSMEVL